MFTPTNSFLLYGGFTSVSILVKIHHQKCEHESARRRTHGQRQTGLMICPMLYAIAMGEIIIYRVILQ